MADQPSEHGFQEWFHVQLEPVNPIQPDPIAKQSSFESMNAEDDQEEGWREKEFIQGSQIVKLSPDGKLIPLVRSVVDDPEDDKSDEESNDDDFEFLYGRQTPSTDGSVSPLQLTARSAPLTHEPVGSELSSSDAVTIRECSKANAGASIDSVLHQPSQPLPARLGGLPRMPSQALITMEPDKRDAFLDWKVEKAEKSLLPTPLRIPEKAVTKESRGLGSAPRTDSVVKGKKRETISHEDQNVVVEKGPAMLYEPENVSVSGKRVSEGSKHSGSLCDSTSSNSAVLYQHRLLPKTPTSLFGSVRQIPKPRTSMDSNADSMASNKYNVSVASSVSSRDKPLPPAPPAALGPAFEMLRRRNSVASGSRAMNRASPKEEQFRMAQGKLRSPRRSITPIQEGNKLDELATSPAPTTEPDEEDESHIHPLMRKNDLAVERYAGTKSMGSLLREFDHHRRHPSGSSSEIVSPDDMKSPFTQSSTTPSSYLHSPPSSPVPESGYESDSLSELPLFRSARSSPLNLLMNYKRASLDARASLEMNGPGSPYIRRNFKPERRRSREELKEYAEAIEAIHGMERLRDIDDEIKDALVLEKKDLINLGDIPNPSLSKISLSPVANRTWPMKKKSSLLRKLSFAELGSEAQGMRERSSTMSSGSIIQHSPVGIRSLSGSSGNTNTTDGGALPIHTPTSSVAPDTPRKNTLGRVFGSWAQRNRHELVMKDISTRGHELEIMEPAKEEHEDMGNGPEEDKSKEEEKPKTIHGRSFLKRFVKATPILLTLKVLTFDSAGRKGQTDSKHFGNSASVRDRSSSILVDIWIGKTEWRDF